MSIFLGRLTVIAEDSAKVSYNVDDKEDGSFSGSHGEIASFGVSLNRMPLPCFNQKIVDLAWTPEISVCCVGRKCKDKYDYD